MPIVVNQHYYLSPPSQNPLYTKTQNAISKLNLGSVVDLASDILPAVNIPHVFDDGLRPWHCYGSQLLSQSAALYDQVSHKFDNVMTLIDRDWFSGNEKDLLTYQPTQLPMPPLAPPASVAANKPLTKRTARDSGPKKDLKEQTAAVATTAISGDSFSKVELYANSRLPMNLPPLKL